LFLLASLNLSLVSIQCKSYLYKSKFRTLLRRCNCTRVCE